MAFSTWELPEQAIAFCLSEAGLQPHEIDAVGFSYDPALAPQPNGDITAAEFQRQVIALAKGFVAAGLFHHATMAG